MGTRRIAAVMTALFSASGWAMAAGVDAGRPMVVDEGKLAGYWAAAPESDFAAPGYPGAYAADGDDVCLAIGYTISADGRTGDFAVLREWRGGDGAEPGGEYWDAYAQAGANAIANWRFAPRAGVAPRETYTVATMAFSGHGAAPEVRAHCRVDDLVALLQARQSRYVMDYSPTKRDMERTGRRVEAARIRAVAAAAARRAQNPPPPPPQSLAAR